MNKRIHGVWTIVFVVIFNLFLGVVSQAKSNVSDELWEEKLMDIEASDDAKVAIKSEKDLLHEPIMIDVLDLKRMDILDVLKLISQKSGLNIVAGQNVTGKVTVFLKNVEVSEVLRIIVAAYGWAYIQDGDIIRIVTDKEYEMQYGYRYGQAMETRIKQLQYAKTEDVLTVIKQMKSISGKVIADANSGILILTAL